MRPATFDAIDTRSQGDDQKGHLTGALPCMRKRPPSFLAINQILVLRPLTKTPPCINSSSARRFGRKLQTPFIGFGKEQSHESFGRSERPADRGAIPVMRTWPPSLAIQILAESTKEGAEDFSKPMAAWTPLFLSNPRVRVLVGKSPRVRVRGMFKKSANVSRRSARLLPLCGVWRCRYATPRRAAPVLGRKALALRRVRCRRVCV